MSQTKTHSAVEAAANVVIGYGVSLVANATILPLFGLAISMSDNISIGAIYTSISIARSYCVRRAFNKLHNCRSLAYNTRNVITGALHGNVDGNSSRGI